MGRQVYRSLGHCNVILSVQGLLPVQWDLSLPASNPNLLWWRKLQYRWRWLRRECRERRGRGSPCCTNISPLLVKSLCLQQLLQPTATPIVVYDPAIISAKEQMLTVWFQEAHKKIYHPFIADVPFSALYTIILSLSQKDEVVPKKEGQHV